MQYQYGTVLWYADDVAFFNLRVLRCVALYYRTDYRAPSIDLERIIKLETYQLLYCTTITLAIYSLFEIYFSFSFLVQFNSIYV